MLSPNHRMQASGQPVRKGTSSAAPAAPTPVKPQPRSPVVVDLCLTPLHTPPASIAGVSNADSFSELEMMDMAQAPVRQSVPGVLGADTTEGSSP